MMISKMQNKKKSIILKKQHIKNLLIIKEVIYKKELDKVQ